LVQFITHSSSHHKNGNNHFKKISQKKISSSTLFQIKLLDVKFAVPFLFEQHQ